MRPWGEFLHSKGYTVRVPLLPGHGTEPEQLNQVKWQEWPAKVEFESKESAKSALNELNEAEIEGIAIKLELVSEEYFRFQTNKNLKRREFK
jgi:esterase/lipase